MSEIDDLYSALQRADEMAEAGDAQARQDAQQLAALIREAESSQAPPSSPPPGVPPPTIPEEPGGFAKFLGAGGAGSILDTVAQGATLGFSDEIAGGLAAGANSIANLFGGGVDESFSDFYRMARDSARDDNKAYSARNPGVATASEIAGGVLTGGAGAARAGLLSGGARLGKLAGIGAAQGGAYGLGAAEGGVSDQLKGAATGALAGGITSAAAPSLLRGAGAAGKKLLGIEPLNSVARRSVNLLERAGVKLTAGQRSGSAAVSQLEGTVKDVPLVGTPLAKRVEDQRLQFQKVLMQKSGFVDDDISDGLITTDAIRRAQESFTDKYIDKLRGVNVSIGPRFGRALDQVEAKYNNSLAGAVNKDFKKIVREVRNRTSAGNLTGRAYQNLRSELAELKRQSRNEPRKQALYGEIKNGLDAAFSNAAGAATGRRLKRLNNRYAQLMQIKQLNDASAGGTNGFANGMMPISRIAALAQKSPGSKSWQELTRAGQAVLVDGVANSGTAQRTAALSGSMGFLGALAGGNLGTAAAIAGTAGAGNLMSRGLANPQATGRLAQGVGKKITNAGLLSAAPVAGLFSAQPPDPEAVPPMLQR